MDKNHIIGKYCYSLNWGNWKGSFGTIREAVDAAREEAKKHKGGTLKEVDISQWAKREIDPEDLGGDVAGIINGMGFCEYGNDDDAISIRWVENEEINEDFAKWVTQWLKDHKLWNEAPMTKSCIRIRLENYNLTGNFEQKILRGLVEKNELYQEYQKEFGGKRK